MLLTTTNSIQGKLINNYIGIITATVYVKPNTSKGMSFMDHFKTEKIYENAEEGIEAGKKEAFEKLAILAKEKQAMAVIGISMDMEITRDGLTRAISVMGTAVSYE
ncbi:heavy metal-binding domain-containing protein [Dokdonia sp. Hel_I_53]|uniref:heavy metal-binding domain-containing protein n=1 Tax=Dokdonia sp. Hel_I_53 TaxID=1566287 RepID=UPI00119BDA54|nr:heavy metal-binding domain-containing protein [Dokdonia sp. Hel_I_53]TVZ50990.1 uncharacterized protein YbjQ (UPF0145 family) [Dokdonia sp. Hel_I_53]